MKNQPRYILPIIVLAQFCCTSLWFASNGVMQDLAQNFGLGPTAIGSLTAAVQFGFISGTLMFALFTLTDRFSPSRVFLVCALLGAGSNALLLWNGNTATSFFIFRYLTGFFLAGIYPVGMKIAADYFDKGLGTSLGYLVGALVLGTAFPHLLKNFDQLLSWQEVITITSGLAILGSVLIWTLVPNGPYRKPSQKLQLTAFFQVFQNKQFRAAAFGYFGHMWELYALWAFVPLLLANFAKTHATSLSVPFWSFAIIGVGGLACMVGGHIAQTKGSKKTARTALFLSGCCCVLLPLVFLMGNPAFFLAFLLFWGMVVAADSPQFSTLVAHNAIPELKGTALTIVNCIGFAISIVSLQVLSFLLQQTTNIWIYVLLALGPAFGLYHLVSKKAGLTKNGYL